MQLLTERLRIRSLTDSDLPAFENTLNDIQRSCMGGASQFLNWIISQYTDMNIVNTLISLGIFDKSTGVLLGTVGAGNHDDLHEPEIFYKLLPEYRGHGYAAEAVRALTKWIFENYPIPYVIGTAEVSNVASQKVLERCGFQFVDNRTLLVHLEGKQYDFKYYRCYPA